MLRIDPSIALDVELNGNGAGKHAFQGGDPQTGREATQCPAKWLNAVQEEIAAVVEGAGIALDSIKLDQLLTAVKAIAWGTNKTSSPWAPVASPALTGTPTAPTAVDGTNTTQIATTAFVNAEIAADRPFEDTTANIKMDGAQSVGTLNTVARGDHVHPTDTSRAPLASPALTGTPTAPTPATGTRTTQLATTAFVGAESQIAAPTGSVYTFAGATVPTGWLKCNGALLSRTTYAALFAVIGTTYGAGDGSTTFALPDLRGEFVRGFDDGRAIDSGRALGSKQGDAIRNMSGEVRFQTVTGGDQLIWLSSGVFSHSADSMQGSHNQIASVGGGSWEQILSFSADKDVPTAAENRPRNVAMHYIIKY